jgi:predicted kinase
MMSVLAAGGLQVGSRNYNWILATGSSENFDFRVLDKTMFKRQPSLIGENRDGFKLHIVSGAAGTGKSTFGKRLAARHSAILLDSDTVTEPVVRAGMSAAGLDATDRDSAAYKEIFRDAVYECLFATALENISHTSVVIVGPFTRELSQSVWPRILQMKFGFRPIIWFLHCDDEIRRQRIEDRGNPRDALKLVDWHLHIAEAPVVSPAFSVKRIDTSHGLADH